MTTSDPVSGRGTVHTPYTPGTAANVEPDHGRRDVDALRHLFSRRANRAGLAWVAATIPIAAVLGVFIHGQRNYLLAWVLIGALNLLPALGLSIIAHHRAAEADKKLGPR